MSVGRQRSVILFVLLLLPLLLGDAPRNSVVKCADAIEQAELLYAGRRVVSETEMPFALHCAAQAFEAHGRMSDAETLFVRAVAESEATSDRASLAESLTLLSRFYARQQRETDVLSVWDRQLSLGRAGKVGDPLMLSPIMLEIAEEHYKRSEYEKAMDFTSRIVAVHGDKMFGNPALDAPWLSDLYERQGLVEFADHIHQSRISNAPSRAILTHELEEYAVFLARNGRPAEAESTRLRAQRAKVEE